MSWKVFVCGSVALLCVGTLVLAAGHPRDPWVFRSVLDTRARMLTAAFNDKLYVAYDTQDCTLRKAWAGDVKFTGGVYDARHGPQPQSEGPAYFRIADDSSGWSFSSPNWKVAYKPQFLGYRVGKDDVHIDFKFEGSGSLVTVEESPACELKGDTVTLVRTIKVAGLPEGAKLTLPLAHKADDPEVEVSVETEASPAAAFAQRSSTTAAASAVVIEKDGVVRVKMAWRVK